MPAEIYLNVAVSGLLTGLVYGLMALGLSVIFGVVRVVNFAHGEMMTIAMYLAVVLFSPLSPRPAGDDGADRRRAVRARLRHAARPDQSVHQPARAQPVHAAGRGGADPGERAPDHLRPRRAGRADVLFVRELRGWAADRRRQQGLRRRCRLGRGRGAVRLLPLHAGGQGHPRLRRQLCRRARGRARRQAPLRAHLRHRRGLRRRRPAA